jgi:hypothetical protein
MNRGSKHFDMLGLVDAAKGLTPTYSGFTTQVPTNLTNATDGDLDTYTGEGQETLATSGNVGWFDLDLIKPGLFICGAKIRTHRSAGDAGAIRVDGHSKPNGINWIRIDTIRYSSDIDMTSNTLFFLVTGQHSRLRIYCAGANGGDTMSVWLYNFFAFRLK